MNDAPDEWLGLFDAQEINRQAELLSSKRVKRNWIKRGYSHQLSLYGVARNAETDQAGYKRIEVLSNTPWTEAIVAQIYAFFDDLIPVAAYTLWVYDVARDSVKQVGRYP